MLVAYIIVLLMLNCSMPVWKEMEVGGKWDGSTYGLFFMASVLWPMYLLAGVAYGGYKLFELPLHYLHGQIGRVGKALKEKSEHKQLADRYYEEAEVEIELLLRGRDG